MLEGCRELASHRHFELYELEEISLVDFHLLHPYSRVQMPVEYRCESHYSHGFHRKSGEKPVEPRAVYRLLNFTQVWSKYIVHTSIVPFI